MLRDMPYGLIITKMAILMIAANKFGRNRRRQRPLLAEALPFHLRLQLEQDFGPMVVVVLELVRQQIALHIYGLMQIPVNYRLNQII